MGYSGGAAASSSSSSGSGSSSESGGDDYLDALSRKQVLEINSAFDGVIARDSGRTGQDDRPPASKKRRIAGSSNVNAKGKGKAKAEEDAPATGGFFAEEADDDGGEGGAGGGGGGGGGGFFLPEDEPTGGGFMLDETTTRAGAGSSSSKSKARAAAKSVLLDQIPSVLVALGLDGDDPSILSIFEAASQDDAEGIAIVKRKKFLRVAAVLIAQRDEENATATARGSTGKKVKSGGGKGRAVRLDVDEEADEEEHDDSDPLVLSSDDDEDDEDHVEDGDSDPWADEDDLDGAFAPTSGRGSSPATTRRTTRSRATGKDLDSLPGSPEAGSSKTKASLRSSPKGKGKGKAGTSGSKQSDGRKELRLSREQRDECERMFHQFFNSNDKSKNRAISLAEIRYVATLLNEKISDADVGRSVLPCGF